MNKLQFDPQEVRRIVAEELSNLAETIKQNHRAAGQVASGRTLRSIRSNIIKCSPTITEGAVFGRFPFGTLETGRRGADKGCPKVPADFYGIIYQWMKDKGIQATREGSQTQEQANRTFAYFVARKIQRSGTKLQREGGRTDIYSNAIPSAVDRIADRVGLLFSANVEKMITINTK